MDERFIRKGGVQIARMGSPLSTQEQGTHEAAGMSEQYERRAAKRKGFGGNEAQIKRQTYRSCGATTMDDVTGHAYNGTPAMGLCYVNCG